MTGFSPSRDPGDAERTLSTLVRPLHDRLSLAGRIQRLQSMSSVCSANCPPPWATADLQITPEINYQSELWLPLERIRPHFYSLYRQALSNPPLLSSTPFPQGASWAAIVAGFPPFLARFINPADLLEQLAADDGLRMRFLFWSFMPKRFYGGGSDRYPGQSAAIAEWLRQRNRQGKKLRCLDAACGDGAASYGLARLCVGSGWSPGSFEIEGWTLEPLEAWAAAHGRFPHEPSREVEFREETRYCFERGLAEAIHFRYRDILRPYETGEYDLILCNGLLGGPIVNTWTDLHAVVHNLSRLLAPGGMLMAADHFHGGWKQKCPQQELRALFEKNGFLIVEAEEGISALKPD